MKSFSINEALSAGWAAFTSRVGFFIGLLLLWGGLTLIPQLIVKSIENTGLAIVLAIALQLFQIFLGVGGLRISLLILDGRPVSIGDLFSGGPVFVPYLLATILFYLAASVGLALLVVPGIIVMVVFGYYPFFIIDQGLGPVDALKASAALTEGVRLKLFGFGLVVILLYLLGALLVGLGLFVAAPVVLVSVAHVYRQLLSQTPRPQNI